MSGGSSGTDPYHQKDPPNRSKTTEEEQLSEKLKRTRSSVSNMPKSSDTPPSTNDKLNWIYAAPKGEPVIRVRRREFTLMLKLDNEEIVFVEQTGAGITEKRFPLSEESLDWGAQNYEIMSGKWLIFRQRDQIDDIWTMIEKETRKEELGIASKVSTLLQGKVRHVICVYTNNYLDKGDVFRVRENLRELGIDESLYYKPDIYTKLGIYSGTTKLRPWRYKG